MSVSVDARRDGVDADAASARTPGERPGQPDEPGLRGASRRRSRRSPICPRRDATLTMEPPPRSTIDGSAARQVWNAAVRSVRDDRVPLVRLDRRNGADLGPAGVVDEPVDPPEALDRPARTSALGLVAVGQVGLERLAVAARLADPRERRRRAVRRPVVVDRDRGALGRGLDRDLGADPAAAARHEDDPARQGIAHQATPRGAAGPRRRAPRGSPRVSASDTAWSGGRMTVDSITPSSRSATFVRAR